MIGLGFRDSVCVRSGAKINLEKSQNVFQSFSGKRF